MFAAAPGARRPVHGWGRRAPWTGILARPAALSFPATFPGRSRPPPVMGPDPRMRIAVVAPSSRFSEEAATRVTAIAARAQPEVEVHFHPQCFLSHNHFAGTDA